MSEHSLLQASSAINSIHSSMPPCTTTSRLVEDEIDHRVDHSQAVSEAQIEATTRTNVESRNGAFREVRPQLTASDAFTRAAIVPAAPDTAVLMTTIGLGIDPFFQSHSANATVAAIKAVRDAMERTAMRFPADNLCLHIQLGVPPKDPNQTEPMHVDMGHITPLLPSCVPLLPVEIVVGGLLAGTSSALTPGTHSTCTVVACVSLRKASVPPADVVTVSPTTRVHLHLNPRIEQTAAHVEAICPKPICAASLEAAEVLSGSLNKTRNSPDLPARNNIDVLAHISAELHEGEPVVGTNSPLDDATGNYSYKKLPPGMTNKKNTRLFVNHSYRDYSREFPLVDELDLMDSPTNHTRTVNAAFPLKLHETLSLIEKDGNDGIIGWLPHGRSFKIHQQNAFVEMILPKYFVMTKKSSFLRQLNLYGFNRLSGAGPDQGSYYHETFLRGMKFLCRRIHRQKVNGNGIRAAGNPEGEPNLSSIPSCPPEMSQRRLHLVQASAIRSPLSSPPSAASGKNNRYNSSPDVKLVGVHLAVKEQKGSVSSTEIDRIQEDQSSAGDSGVSEAVKSSTQSAVSLLSASFPLKLHCILDKLESEGSNDIISWLPHGRAFLVYSVDRLVDELMPRFFNQSKYSSFQRQLHMYHFQRITAGRDKGSYHHPSFLRGCSDLCMKMTRTRVNGKGTRRPGNPDVEPDFYGMDVIPFVLPGTVIHVPADPESTHQESKKRSRVSSCGSDSS